MKEDLIKYIKNNFKYHHGLILRTKPKGRLPVNSELVGSVVSAKGKKYIRCSFSIEKVRYSAYKHVIIFILLNDYAPPYVDHKDGNSMNNEPNNLRACYSHKNNCSNRNLNKNNLTGYKGVSYHKATGKYRAYIKVNYKQIHLGTHDTPEEAAKVYNEKALTEFGEFAKLNIIK